MNFIQSHYFLYKTSIAPNTSGTINACNSALIMFFVYTFTVILYYNENCMRNKMALLYIVHVIIYICIHICIHAYNNGSSEHMHTIAIALNTLLTRTYVI